MLGGIRNRFSDSSSRTKLESLQGVFHLFERLSEPLSGTGKVQANKIRSALPEIITVAECHMRFLQEKLRWLFLFNNPRIFTVEPRQVCGFHPAHPDQRQFFSQVSIEIISARL